MNIVYPRFPPRMYSERAHATSGVLREAQMCLVQDKKGSLSFSLRQVFILSHVLTSQSARALLLPLPFSPWSPGQDAHVPPALGHQSIGSTMERRLWDPGKERHEEMKLDIKGCIF